jgi:hypothetical protein
VSHDGFKAEAGEIDVAGRAFIAEAEDLAGRISAFSGAAQNVGGAFGGLGPSEEVLNEYLQMARDTVEALGKLRETVELTGEGLRTTARNYGRADSSSVMPGGPR